MFAVLGNQPRRNDFGWLSHPLAVVLEGTGGGSWRIEPGGALTEGPAEAAAAVIVGQSTEFPEWATCRAAWRDRNIRMLGDEEYAIRFLDSLNIV
jgi:hypothetical protein